MNNFFGSEVELQGFELMESGSCLFFAKNGPSHSGPRPFWSQPFWSYQFVLNDLYCFIRITRIKYEEKQEYLKDNTEAHFLAIGLTTILRIFDMVWHITRDTCHVTHDTILRISKIFYMLSNDSLLYQDYESGIHGNISMISTIFGLHGGIFMSVTLFHRN